MRCSLRTVEQFAIYFRRVDFKVSPSIKAVVVSELIDQGWADGEVCRAYIAVTWVGVILHAFQKLNAVEKSFRGVLIVTITEVSVDFGIDVGVNADDVVPARMSAAACLLEVRHAVERRSRSKYCVRLREEVQDRFAPAIDAVGWNDVSRERRAIILRISHNQQRVAGVDALRKVAIAFQRRWHVADLVRSIHQLARVLLAGEEEQLRLIRVE